MLKVIFSYLNKQNIISIDEKLYVQQIIAVLCNFIQSIKSKFYSIL